jgi:mono/diheme cytochrome c family protein
MNIFPIFAVLILKRKIMTKYILSGLILVFTWGCGGSTQSTTEETVTPPKSMLATQQDPMENKGIGPVKELTLPAEIDQEMAEAGKAIYMQMCTACHKPDKKFIGPPPKGVLDRRSPEWVMNMILNPEVMIMKDPIAKQLLIEYNGAPMSNQNLSQEQARQILEYFRTL